MQRQRRGSYRAHRRSYSGEDCEFVSLWRREWLAGRMCCIKAFGGLLEMPLDDGLCVKILLVVRDDEI
jgi:hypothetical protein